MTRQRDHNIDLVRVVIIVMVVLAHSIQETSAVGSSPLFLMFGFAVARIFFMASGALIYPVRPSGREFLKRRARRVVPPFVLWSVIYVILACVSGEKSWADAPVDTLMMFIVPTFKPGWFVIALLGVYLVAPIISPWVERASKRTIEKFLAVWLLSGFLPIVMVHTDVDITKSIFAGYFSFAGFTVMGYYLTRWPLRERRRREVVTFVAVMLFLWLGYGSWFYLKAVKWDFVPALFNSLNVNFMAYSTLLFALLISVPKSQSLRRFVTRQSRHVYTIFLSHFAILKYLVIPLLSSLTPALSPTITNSPIITPIITFTLTLTLTYLLSRLLHAKH
jgi:surface polysaccharide O-acyltransferase-like enzyme